MAIYYDTLTPAMQGILDCAEAGLLADGRGVGLAHLAPGAQAAYDDCCSGQLWVRVVEMFPSGRPFPQYDTLQKCGVTLLGARIGVGVMRCAHVLDDAGKPPTATQMTADTLAVNQDAATILGTLNCCAKDLPGIELIKVERWAPQGPQGGCVGGEWTAVIALNSCPCPTPDEIHGDAVLGVGVET